MKSLKAAGAELGIRRGRPDRSARGSWRLPSSPAVAPFLSFLWPGLGQEYLKQRQRALFFAIPPLVLVGVLLLAVVQSPQLFALRLLVPSFAFSVIALIAAHGLWWVAAVLDAWRLSGAGSRAHDRSLVVAVALSALLVLGHFSAGAYVQAFSAASAPIFSAGETADDMWDEQPAQPGGVDAPAQQPVPGSSLLPTPTASATASPVPIEQDGLINVLVVGIDSGPGRDHALTDTLIAASYDIAANEITMVSIPRDVSRMPLYNGGRYDGRINGFLSYARDKPEKFPEGAMAALVSQVEHLLGIDFDYYAATDMAGLERLVDMVGGVDVMLEKPINDHFWKFYLKPGRHHLDGPRAMMYVRSRFGPSNSDFERARRQQQVIRALAERMKDPGVLARLPEVMEAAAQMARTDAPVERVPEFLALLERLDGEEMRQIVLRPPKYAQRVPASEAGNAYMIELKMDAVKELSRELFGEHSRYADEGQP